ncbi:MAG: right-handed parallel beta-helix repeat-containing protein, partial [Treponema sp.]|nr:right-handed parallel beta-helix repeat-containing protein [Treponema sp.]
MKKIIFITLITSILLTSCNNLIQGNSDSQTQTENTTNDDSTSTTEQVITFTGTIETSGALPSQIISMMQEVNSRAALPELGTLSYFATASNGSKTVTGTFLENSNPVTFEIGLTIGSTWDITCGIKSDGTEIFTDSYQVEITTSDPIASHTFQPEPASGKGSVSLTMQLEEASNVNRIVTYSEPDVIWTTNADGTSATLTATDINSGNYDVTINFYNSDDLLLFSTSQNINVLNGLTTNTWSSDGGDLINNDNIFSLTSEIINNFASRTIYVGSTPVSQNNNFTPSDTNGTGNAYTPFATLNRAIDIINTRNDGESAYIIFVSGTQDVSQGSITISPESDLNLTIQSLSGSAADAIIDGGNSQRCIDITSDEAVLNLTLKNLTVQNGYLSGATGAGILIAAIPSDSIINIQGLDIKNNNITNGSGAGLGVYANTMNTYTVNIKDTNIISNTISVTASNYYYGAGLYVHNNNINKFTINISGNTLISQNSITGEGVKSGAGIYVYGQTLNISGNTTIKQNSSQYGAGIYLAGLSDATLTGTNISNNQGTSSGAGIYIGGIGSAYNRVITLNSCKITGNETTNAYGAGIYHESVRQLILNSTEISDNKIIHNDTAQTYYGAGLTVRDKAINLTITGSSKITGNSIDSSSFSGTDSSYPIDKGAGLYLGNAATTTIKGSTEISGNSFVFPDATSYPSATSYGSGIYLDGGSLTISGSTEISNNSSSMGNGAGICNFGSSSIVYLSSGTIKGNQAKSGGGIFNKGDLFIYGSTIIGETSSSVAQEDSCSNKATNGSGGAIYNSGNLYLGYKSKTTNDVLISSSFTGGIYYNYASSDGGGIFSVGQTNVYINSGTIANNTAGGTATNNGGGGIFISSTSSDSYSTLNILGGSISNNKAENGAGLYITGTYSKSYLSGGDIKGNQASSGGGIYNNGDLFIYGSTIIGETSSSVAQEDSCSNKATNGSGGAIYNSG